MSSIRQAIVTCALLALAGGSTLASARDQSRIAEFDRPSVIAENAAPLPSAEPEAPAPSGEETTTPDGAEPEAAPTDESGEDDLNLGEIPDLKSIELTADIAKRALDTYLLVREKYKDADLESYDDLQEFVDKNERGQEFETDIKAAGFASVNDWNVAITTLGFTYSGLLDDPTADIKQQIDEIQNDDTIAQDLKDRMIASLNAMIPSENNKKVVADLMADPAYKEKLAELDSAEGDSEGE